MLNLLPITALWRPCRLFHAPTDAESSQTDLVYKFSEGTCWAFKDVDGGWMDVDAEHFKHFESKGAC